MTTPTPAEDPWSGVPDAGTRPVQHDSRRPPRWVPRALAMAVVAVFVALNLMLSWIIIRPIANMSGAADKVSIGNFDIPEFSEVGKDEVSVLAASFNRMRRSLQQAMKLIET